MDLVNVVMFDLVIVSDTTTDFLPGDSEDLLNWIDLDHDSLVDLYSIGQLCVEMT